MDKKSMVPMMDKKTAIAVVVSIAVIVFIAGGGGLISSMFSGSAAVTSQDVNTQQMQTQVQIKDIKLGDGAVAMVGKTVTVNYTGVFSDGKKFDSSRDPGRTPFTFTLGAGQVIKGWDIGVLGMKVGGSRILIIPPEFGYGDKAYGPIPASSTLIFEIDLLKVE